LNFIQTCLRPNTSPSRQQDDHWASTSAAELEIQIKSIVAILVHAPTSQFAVYTGNHSAVDSHDFITWISNYIDHNPSAKLMDGLQYGGMPYLVTEPRYTGVWRIWGAFLDMLPSVPFLNYISNWISSIYRSLGGDGEWSLSSMMWMPIVLFMLFSFTTRLLSF